MKTPILGSSYVARSVNAADNRMVNLFPEMIPEGGKEPAFLQRCPGLSTMTVPGMGSGTGPIRGLYVVGTNMYVVTGTELYEVDQNGNATLRGTVNDSLPVSMADNGTQLFIASGLQSGDSYIYNMDTTVFAQITDPDFPASGAGSVTYLDGFFVFNEKDSGRVWVTDLLDGTSVQPLNFASAEANSDDVIAVAAKGDELWVFGNTTTEVWHNAGNPGFPFAPIQGAFTEMGCAASKSVVNTNNSFFWVGSNSEGSGVVYRSNGYRGERISTSSVEKWLNDYINTNPGGNTIAEATAFSYQQSGHLFYVLCLFGSDTSWAYDVTTGAWHERAGWDGSAFTQYPGICHAYHRENHVLGSYDSNDLYEMIEDQGSGATLLSSKWLRSWRALPQGANNLKRTAHHSLQIDFETGVGNAVAADPEVSLRFSDDGGHTWSNSRTLTLGTSGSYDKRVIWRRLGMTMKLRDRVYEVSGTDQANIFIMGAELILSPTDA